MSKAVTLRTLQKSLKTFSHSDSSTESAIFSYYSSLDTPKSLACWLLFVNNEHDQLTEIDLNVRDYLTAEAFHLDYLAVSFLAKADFLSTSFNKESKALAKFQLMEQQCNRTNQRLRYDKGLKSPEFGALLFAMRYKISQVLGEFDVEELFEKASWGPGSSTLVKGDDVSHKRKFQSETGITANLYTHMQAVLPLAYPLWFGREHLGDSSLTLEAGNTVTTVPKNSKTDRVIAVEPGLNLWFQKGCGDMIRSRLRRFGIDLNSQKRNQELARQGVELNLATVDFSSASDTISIELIRSVLPERWFTVLDACRSKAGILQNSQFEWNKFSSMGNGFTFELESLIFYSAAVAVCDHLGLNTHFVSVFGDDVIIPNQAFALYSSFCDFLGFTVNPEKSFSSGSFRESCGAHYFRGSDVKPLYLKKRLQNAFCSYKLANSIRRLAHRRCFNIGCDRRFLPVWRSIVARLPNDLRTIKIPDGFGDGGLLSNFDEATPIRLRDQIEGYKTFNATQIGRSFDTEVMGLHLARLWKTGTSTYGYEPVEGSFQFSEGIDKVESDQGYKNSYTLRGQALWRIKPLNVPSWYDLGPWY